MQRLRWSLFAVLASLPVCAYVYVWSETSRRVPRLLAPPVLVLVALTALWIFLTARARTALRHRGLGAGEVDRVMITAAPSQVGFWTRPHVAAILAPAPLDRPRSDSPHGQIQAILADASVLSGPLRPLGAQAAVAARQLLASIDQEDREIAALARNLEPGEEERLAEKIEALRGDAAAGSDYAPMRLLLEKQIQIIRGLQGRIEQTKERRARRIEMLKTLALHVASLRARSAQTPAEVGALSERVRVLCSDIAREAEGIAPAGEGTAATLPMADDGRAS